MKIANERPLIESSLTLRVVRSNVPVRPDLSAMTDKELMELMATKRDTAALGVLYDRYHKVVLNRAWGLVKERTQAEDLAHDIFMKLYTNAHKYKAEGSFTSWFGVLSYNVVMDALRARKLARFDELDEDRMSGSGLDETAVVVEEKMLFEVQLEALMEVLNALQIEDRTVLLMKYQDDLSIRDIADTLAIGESAVKMRLMRARRKVLVEYAKPIEHE